MTTEMIERGVDALIANFKATVEANCAAFGEKRAFDDTKVQCPSRDVFRPMVVVVMNALRGDNVDFPIPVLIAGKNSLYSCSEDPEIEDARACFQAMIGEMLK